MTTCAGAVVEVVELISAAFMNTLAPLLYKTVLVERPHGILNTNLKPCEDDKRRWVHALSEDSHLISQYASKSVMFDGNLVMTSPAENNRGVQSILSVRASLHESSMSDGSWLVELKNFTHLTPGAKRAPMDITTGNLIAANVTLEP